MTASSNFGPLTDILFLKHDSTIFSKVVQGLDEGYKRSFIPFFGRSEKGLACLVMEWIKKTWSGFFLKFSSNPFFSEIMRA